MRCFNCRGLASSFKKLAMRRLFENEPTDIIMLQETLGNDESIEQTLSTVKPGWQFHALDAIGRSGGLAIGYNPRSINASATWGGVGFIGLDLFSAELGLSIGFINVYGPCQRREDFW